MHNVRFSEQNGYMIILCKVPLAQCLTLSKSSINAKKNCCFSIVQSCLTLCSPMECSTPDFPVLHHLLDLAQTHVHQIGDTIQPSHPLSFPSPPAFNLSQHQGLFKWVSSFQQVAKVLELQFQHQSFQWILRADFVYNWLVWSPCCSRDSQEFSSTTVQKHQFFGTLPSLWSSSHIHTWLLEKP